MGTDGEPTVVVGVLGDERSRKPRPVETLAERGPTATPRVRQNIRYASGTCTYASRRKRRRTTDISRCEPPSWRSGPRRSVWSCVAPTRTEIHVGSSDQNPSSMMEGRGLLMTEARAWMSSWSVRSVHCWRTGSGHMGATPQPKGTVASSDNQRRKFRKSGVSNVSESNQRSGESIDTVGVTGSIPVSPTIGGPGLRGLQSCPDLPRAVLGPRERWVRWLAMVPVSPRCGPTAVVRAFNPAW
jgi:hypothetical protein